MLLNVHAFGGTFAFSQSQNQRSKCKKVIKTSEIEGEFLSRQDMMSCIKNKLGPSKGNPSKDKRAKDVNELLIAVRNTFDQAQNEDTLFQWHRLLSGNDMNSQLYLDGIWGLLGDVLRMMQRLQLNELVIRMVKKEQF